MIFSSKETKSNPGPSESEIRARSELCVLLLLATVPLGQRLLDLGFLGAVLFVIWNWRAFLRLLRAPDISGGLLRAILGFCAVCLLGAWAAGFEGGLSSALRLREHGAGLVFGLVLHRAGPKLRWKMLVALGVGMAASLLVAHAQFFAHVAPAADWLGISIKQRSVLHPGLPGRLAGSGLLYDRIPFSILCLMVSTFAWGLAFETSLTQRQRRWVRLLAMLVSLGPFLAGSRMAILLMPVGIFAATWPLLKHRVKSAQRKIVSCLIGFTVLTVLFLTPVGGATQFRSLSATGQNQDRMFIWGRAIEVFVDKPMFGTGYGHYPKASPTLYHSANPRLPAKNHGHNLVVTLLAETGLVGFWAFVWMMFRFWRACRLRRRDPWARSAFGACLMFFAASLVHDPLFQSNLAVCFWFYACLAAMPPGENGNDNV